MPEDILLNYNNMTNWVTTASADIIIEPKRIRARTGSDLCWNSAGDESDGEIRNK